MLPARDRHLAPAREIDRPRGTVAEWAGAALSLGILSHACAPIPLGPGTAGAAAAIGCLAALFLDRAAKRCTGAAVLLQTALPLAALLLLGQARAGEAAFRFERDLRLFEDRSGVAWVRFEPLDAAWTRVRTSAIRPARGGSRACGASLRFVASAATRDSLIARGTPEWQGLARLEPARPARFPGDWNERENLRAEGSIGRLVPLLLAPCTESGKVCERPGMAGPETGNARPATAGWPRERAPARGRIERWIEGRREAWSGAIAARVGPPAGNLAAAFLLGRRSEAGRAADREGSLAGAGAGHLLAVSGLHVGLVGLCLLAVLRLAGLRPAPRAVLFCAGLAAYGTLVGWSASVTRAAGAGILWALCEACRRKPRARTLLVVILAGNLWAAPDAWRSPGLQLSYLVSLALIGAHARRPGRPTPLSPDEIVGRTIAPEEAQRRAASRERPKPREAGTRPGQPNRWRAKAEGTARVTIAAQSAAWPLLLALQGAASPVYLAGNALLVPLAAIALPALLVGLVAAGLPGFPDGAALAPAWALFTAILALAARLSAWSGPLLVPGRLEQGHAALAALAISLMWQPARFPILARGAAALLAAMAVTLAAHPPAGPRVILLDVGQGEAWMILLENETWGIDAGPAPGTGGRARDCIGFALRANGRRRIDRLFLTHDDTDHSGGLAELRAKGIRAGTVYHPAGWEPGPQTAAWLAQAVAAGTRVLALGAGDSVRADEAVLRVLHPPWEPAHAPQERASANEGGNARGLAFVMEVAGLSGIICADAPAAVIDAWAAAGAIGRAHFVSAAHHGSDASLSHSLLACARPRAVLISVGANNRFGHPGDAALAAFAAMGAAQFRTDRDGMVTLSRERLGWTAGGYASKRTVRLE